MANIENDRRELQALREDLRPTWTGKRLTAKPVPDSQDPPMFHWVAVFADQEVGRRGPFRFTSPGLHPGIEKELDFTV
ncbi:MAG: hypothetical protein NT034_04670 [Candidatus Magasanikbacteria bacterium]|nr:hypothetical protein [Candidatus Magasanikbacteria bacterium]